MLFVRYILVYFFIDTLAKRKPFNKCLRYEWLENDSRFDFTVAITALYGYPLAIGTIITEKYIVTSANPIEDVIHMSLGFSLANKTKQMSGYKVVKSRDVATRYRISVCCIGTMYNISREIHWSEIYMDISDRSNVWVRLGNTKLHSPIHDLIIITMNEKISSTAATVKMSQSGTAGREPFCLANITADSFIPTHWTFPGFGYMDYGHVSLMQRLRVTEYDVSALLNCDEYIPRAWGRFICLSNVDNLYSVQSGSPLFLGHALVGIGSFELHKNRESILVFTNFSIYLESMNITFKGNPMLNIEL